MIVYHKHNEIDREKWDDCILNSPGVKPYAYSWYLDIMAPGWEALIDDDYDAVFPMPCFTKYSIHYIATPIFLQQLGAFSPDKSQSVAIAEFLDYMPESYKLIDLCIGQSITTDEYKITEKANLELDLSIPYDKIWNNFHPSCRRNIQKALIYKSDLTDDISPDELIELFIITKGRQIKGIKQRDFQHLKSLMDYCLKTGKGKIVGVRTSGDIVIFGQFIIETPGSINLFFGVNTHESKEKRINYFVINEVIRENASDNVILDFAGSSITSIASFMKSFGAINNPYYRIYRNRLFWPVRLMK